MPLVVGENVGSYRVLEQLGQGGMATVYKAYHPALDRYVAIKVLHVALSGEAGFIARFKREAQVIARLDNTHIVPVYDFDEHDGQPYLVLKFIDGETLKAHMKAATLSRSDIARVAAAVADGLQYAHEQGILHRDIKPSNILIANNGQIYLTDFGLAKIAESASNLTGDMILGTPHYISPEQAMGLTNLDEGTDIYSFGVMLYELAVGRVPFDADTPFSIIQDHIYAPLPLPTAIKPDLSIDVEKVLLKALAKQRSDRYASVRDLAAAFQQAWMASASVTLVPAALGAMLRAANGSVFRLAANETVLGRNSAVKGVVVDLDLAELDSTKVASRRHAVIKKQSGIFLISDLGSRNGTFVNGTRIPPPQTCTLKAGDVIELGAGGVKLTFTE